MSPRTPAVLVALVLVASGVAGCKGDVVHANPGNTTATVTAPSASPTSARPSVDPSDQAYAKAKEATHRWATQLPVSGPIAGDFMTRDYITKTNDARKAAADAGIHTVGDAKLVSITPVSYSVSPLLTTMRVCSRGDVRLIDKSGKDVTYDSKGQKVPPGDKRSAVLVQLTTPDAGVSWQVNSVQNVGPC